MKKVVSSSIITLLIILLTAAAFIYLRNFRTNGGDPLMAIPADAAWIHIWSPDSSSFGEFLEMDSWPRLVKVPLVAHLHQNIAILDSIFIQNSALLELAESNPVYISAHNTGAGKFDFLILQSMGGYTESTADGIILGIAGSDCTINRRNYDGNTIREIALKDGQFFAYTFSKGVFIASYTPFLVEDALRQLRIGKPMLSTWALGRLSGDAHRLKIAIHFSNLASFMSNFIIPDGNGPLKCLKKFSPWAIADIQVFKNNISLNGFVETGDSLSFQEIFKGQQPVSNELLNILPQKTAYVSWMGFDDSRKFFVNSSKWISERDGYDKNKELLFGISSRYKINIAEQLKGITGNEIALLITEPAGIDFTNQCYGIVNAKSTSRAKAVLKSISAAINKRNNTNTLEENYNGHSIGLIRLTGVTEAVYGPLFRKVKNMYYTVIGDYIIFANQAGALRMLIDDYSSGRLLHRKGAFNSAIHGLADKGNCFLYLNPSSGRYILKSFIQDAWKELPDSYRDVLKTVSGIAFQLTAGPSEHRITCNFNFGGMKSASGVLQLFTVDADSTVAMPVHFSASSDPAKRKMIFQDESGALFCVDNTGKVTWEKESSEKIMGTIHETDLFRNGQKQFLYNNRDYLCMVDESGNPAGNYPIRLPAPATNGITVTDFNNDGDVEIYVACQNGKVYAYTVSGKPLPGWSYNMKTATITLPLKHISFKGKDGLLVTDNSGTVAFIYRNGDPMFPAIPDVQPAHHGYFVTTPENSILTTDTTGALIEIDSDGKMEKTLMTPLDANHGFLYTKVDADSIPDYLFTDRDELIAYNKDRVLLFRLKLEADLDAEILECPISDSKVLLLVRSSKSGKIWLVQKDGTIYPGFPVVGCGPVTLVATGDDGITTLITGGCDSRVHVYSVQ